MSRAGTPLERARAAAGALACAVLAGCAAPTPAPLLLTLPSGAAAGAAAASPAAPSSGVPAPVLAVRRVAIPEYLVARRVRYRADAATLAEWPNTYWAERIEIGVSREFIAALRGQLPGWTLCETSCGERALTLQVELAPMDYVRSTRELQASARLTLSGPGAGPERVRTADFRIGGGADTAQAQAQAIGALLAQVAAAAAPLVQAARP